VRTAWARPLMAPPPVWHNRQPGDCASKEQGEVELRGGGRGEPTGVAGGRAG